MVRLKENSVDCYIHSFFVSIPNGSIKSVTTFKVKIYTRAFQFQMVRLKGQAPYRRCGSRVVSIPNGSIKSLR